MSITLAAYHQIYDTSNVERALGQLPEDSRALARLYEKMIERGGERFVSKPSVVPDVAALREQSPNFGEVIDEVLARDRIGRRYRRSIGVDADPAGR